MITGSMVALITPFREDGSVNYEKLRELIEWHIDDRWRTVFKDIRKNPFLKYDM